MHFLLAFLLAPRPMVISHSGTIPAREYRLVATEFERKAGEQTIPVLPPAVIVRGNNITINFAGSVFRGSPQSTWPDQRKGLCIQVEGNNVTLKNLRVHGYKVGLLAQNCRNLKIVNGDFSCNWKQHLASTPEQEDESDWMGYHHNENREWLRYGAGIYLDSCSTFEVKNTKITGGQCGLMLTKCDHGKVWNNDFSYLSGVGLGLYRSSSNVVMHNRIDYDVRGFSFGKYNRGQDSAGILIFEQCNRNTFAFNSVTHGGDGFFLWAGQHSMDTGEGGCNDNVVYANDFSYAVTNGIEATFSRNKFLYNKIHGCFHGMWGGYSYETKIIGNNFKNNQRGIAIEHGLKNTISANRFEGDDVAIALWAPPVDPNFAYAKHRDVRSHETEISANCFKGVPLALDVKDSTELALRENLFDGVSRPVRVSGEPFSTSSTENVLVNTPDGALPGKKRHVASAPYPFAPTAEALLDLPPRKNGIPRLAGGIRAFFLPDTSRGWKTILVDEWGPYNFRRPLITPLVAPTGQVPLPGGTSAGSGAMKPGDIAKPLETSFQILGPKGRWKWVSAQGIKLEATQGQVPGTVKGKPSGGPLKIELIYEGLATTDPRGIVTPAGVPVKFSYQHFKVDIDWKVKFFRWQESENAVDAQANPKDFAAVLLREPIKEIRTARLDFADASFVPGLPNDHYATLAEGNFDIPAGEYILDVTTDDGARVWLDGKLIIADAWKYQCPTLYSRSVKLGGRHHLRIEHFQIDGYATLKVNLKQRP